MSSIGPGSPADRLIMVIDDARIPAENLKELIEFMDVPRVQISAPKEWRSKLGNRRLAAVFLGKDLAEHQIVQLMDDIGELDPNVPIVMVNGEREDA